MQHFCFCPHFPWAELKDLRLFYVHKTSQYLVWPPFASRSATHLLRIELIRLLIVACDLSKVPDAIECEHLPTQVGYDNELQSGRDPNEDDEHADELPWDGFWPFVQNFFGYANRQF